MLRRRWARALLWLACMAAVFYVLISLHLPSSRRMTLGVDKKNGRVRLVQQHITFLPPFRFYRLDFEKREGYAQRDGLIRIMSKEKVPVTINYRLRFAITGDHLPDARRLVNEGWNAWMRARVAEAVDAVTQQVPIEELLSPQSRFNAERDPLRQTVARHLAQSGLKVTDFKIARIDVDREALLAMKRAELRRAARGIIGRVAVFAIDGADWELLSELSGDGRIPNLKALGKGGTTASMQTIQPTVSPMLWTTVATGLTPDRHGVLDFIDHARNLPVDSATRRAPALWEIAEAFGRHAAVVNWWTAWPPTTPETSYFDAPVELQQNAFHPPALAARYAPLEVPPSTVGYEQVRRFINISQSEYDRAVSEGGPADPVNIFHGVLAKTWSDHRVAINLFRDQQPLLFMMSYEGTDAVNHLFAPYHPPYRDGVSEESYRKYWPTVANYYAEIDRLIGEWMSVLPADTTVLIVSAHGYRWGKLRPYAPPRGRGALSDHRNPGVFIAYGNHVAHNAGAHPVSVYDVAPTVLAILGLPQSAEMPGRFASWALKDVAPVTTVRVVSYSEFIGGRPLPEPPSDPRGYQIALQAIGHLNDPSRNLTPVLEDEPPARDAQPVSPERWGLYAYFNNLGIELQKQGKVSDAIDAFDRAIDINPARPTPYLNKAILLAEKQQYTSADEAFVLAVTKGLPNADRWFTDFAAFYRERNMASRAITVLYKGKELFPQSALIAANLGSALVAASRYTEGVLELERALGLQPSSTEVLNNLGIVYAKKNDYGRALDFWNRSLTIDPRQPVIREAVAAAQTRL